MQEAEIEAARAQLGEVKFAAAWSEGRGLGLEKAVALALAEGFDAAPFSD